MFAGRFVLDFWRASEYTSVAVLKNFLPIKSFANFFFFEKLVIETDSTISSPEFF